MPLTALAYQYIKFSTQFRSVFSVQRGGAARTARWACHGKFRYQGARWVEGAQFGTIAGAWHGRADATAAPRRGGGQSGSLYFKIKQVRAGTPRAMRVHGTMPDPWHAVIRSSLRTQLY